MAATPQVETGNVAAALALLSLTSASGGGSGREDMLIERIETVIDSSPRLGPYGTGIADVMLHAILGRTEAGLRSLAAAIDAGWRIDAWQLQRDPTFESLRSHPAYAELLDRLDRLTVDARQNATSTAELDGYSLLPTSAAD